MNAVGEPGAPGEEAEHIAVIGLACRFPGAAGPEEFWDNLVRGVDSVTRLPERPVPGGSGERYVPAGGFLRDPEWFDAGYFGYSPREARIVDPQHRVFLECAVEALEDAGCDPARFPGAIGVYAGGTDTSYAALLRSRRDALPSVSDWEIRLSTGLDFLTSRAAYKLGLRGPAVTVRAACATSLVAVHMAVQGLLAGDCDLALAGGVTVRFPAEPGAYAEGGILSPGGACRTFDAGASGIVGGDGAGLVALRRLPEALADGDPVRAVIRGTAVNNDGADRIGYTAPGVEGQAAVIRTAQEVAGVDPASVGYVEAHGTATPIGDPIEVAALTLAFTATAARRDGPCALGSVKTNIGHTDAAAGAAGLIKTVMALERGLIPPSLHFTEPNPAIDFASVPFEVVTRPAEWRPRGTPRRAGVSSFGMGGTNAHVVLEQAPPPPSAAPGRPWQLLVLSAKSPAALDAVTERLAAHLRARPGVPVADVAWTLQTGRAEHPFRRHAVVGGAADAVRVLEGRAGDRLRTAGEAARTRPVTLAFPGTTTRRLPGEPAFLRLVGECLAAAPPMTFTPSVHDDLMAFAQEYALARLLASWGIVPAAVLGEGAGALAAAAVAGILPMADAARLVTERARALQGGRGAPGGARGFEALVREVPLRRPEIPLLCDLTGRPLPAGVPGDPGGPVATVTAEPGHAAAEAAALEVAGRLWAAGTPVGWEAVHAGARRARTPLPAYPFERRRYAVDPVASTEPPAPAAPANGGARGTGEAGDAAGSVHAAAGPVNGAGADVGEVVRRLFAEMLGLDRLDPDESFFDLGGDSLVATQFLVRIRKIFPVDVVLRSMFEAPTANAFAALVEERMTGPDAGSDAGPDGSGR
ncbi:type I polyketide synthase [Actinomadura viridis]|uniref:type I polyketide synthase n=1 Tax=Actinomadura viridis TaxID=58110 RepID=UPI0036C6EF6C